MTPWRPAPLFRAAFTPTPDHPTIDGREAERFREHFAKEPGIIKRGPWYALSRWFDQVLPFVTFDDMIALPLSGRCIREAQIEACRRLPNMIVRNPHANHIHRNMAAFNGLTVEKHIAAHFRETWPQFYIPASNSGLYDKAAPDDFSLKLFGKRWTVDVAGSVCKDPPDWKIHPGKMTGANIRIYAYYNDTDIWMQGYDFPVPGSIEKRIFPIERLIVRLNIQALEIVDLF
jgi:hypothetical protein